MGVYCDIEDVKARAGRVRDAWDDTTQPSDGDIERFIRDAESAVNIALASHGFTQPAVDVTVIGSFVPVVADMALLMTLAATWPGDSMPKSAGALYEDVRVRVEGKNGMGGYLKALTEGTLPGLVFLASQAGSASGAASFWTSELGYSSWMDDIQSGQILLDTTGHPLYRSPLGPGVHRDTKF